MILGRAGTSKGRYVRLWDYLQINGSMDITGNLGVGGAPSSHKLDVWGSARMNLLTFHGVGGNSGVGPQNYAIYQEAGPWSNPYPDLVIGYHTGIKIGGHRYYHGTRFYNDAPGRTGAAEIMSVGKADNNVRVNHSLFVESLTKTNILHIGGKWRLSGVGDAHANDGWLRLFNQANTDYYGGFAAGSLWSRSTGTLSDSFLKKNVETLNCSLKKLTSLRGIRFKWKDSKYDSSSKFGLIAQEVEPIFPELVSIGPDRMKSIDYSGFVAPIVEGIKEQQNQILKLSTDNQEQQKKIDLLISKKAGNDLAEYFESVDGKAIPFGISVVLDGDKIRKAKKSETPIGVISANPGNVSGVYFEWPKKYLNDEFGNLIMDAYQEEIMIPKKKKIKSERQKMKKKKISEEVKKTDIVLKKGKYCQKEIKEKVMSEIEEPVFKEADLYDAAGKKKMGKHKIPVMEIYEEEINVFDEDGQPVLVGSGKFETKNRPKLNPKYNESKKYISRENRPEWNCVGLLGQIPLRKGQPVAPSWIKIKDISKKVELWLVK
jgi:hypothetical protein